MSSDDPLRREIDQLGRMFGDVIRRFEGESAFHLIEHIRRLARKSSDGDAAATDELSRLLHTFTLEQLRIVVRAFSTFLELANLAEDRQRVRVLRQRAAAAHPRPTRESIQEAVALLAQQGFSAAQAAALLNQVSIELVFTAHPTEAKRRSLRSKLRAIRGRMQELDSDLLLPHDVERLRTQLRGELIKLWQTDFIRPSAPTVTLEVQRGLSFQPVLWAAVPRVLSELREALATAYPGVEFDLSRVLAFGSWMGGDRDGHPFVTPDITAQTCRWLRSAALDAHLQICRQLADSLSISRRQSPACARLEEQLDSATNRWPALVSELADHGPLESYRRWLRVIHWRLERTAATDLHGPPRDGSYQSDSEFAADVALIREVLIEDGNLEVATTEVQAWLDQIAVFGFHTARLDIRQHSAVYRDVMDELWRGAGLCPPDRSPSEDQRQRLLTDGFQPHAMPNRFESSAKTTQTLNLFRTLRRIARQFGMRALGGHIVSMTRCPSDLLTVLWLWKWSEQTDGGDPRDAELRLPLIPLFETIGDLQRAASILASLLDNRVYRQWLAEQGDRQIVMIGYSDSTKDGGYLAACWHLQRVQRDLHELAAARGVKITFFHGRGGSLGRGGGPAARAILSLPTPAFDGSLRLTEQGEILAERYDDPQVAYRHLQQVLWSVIIAKCKPTNSIPDAWTACMDQVADVSLAAYRRLTDHPSFVQFFSKVTPIRDIESLQIASRPPRRTGSDRIEDLRAIPWVFAWTQCRCLIPAWFGIGAALGQFIADSPENLELLRTMYRDWSFFEATIDNAALALAKSNLPVFRRYANLVGDDPNCREIEAIIETEWKRADEVLRAVTGSDVLLQNVPWLQRSIAARNGYVDPLNLIQVELQLRSRNQGADHAAELAHLRQLTVQGIAAGMRTTG